MKLKAEIGRAAEELVNYIQKSTKQATPNRNQSSIKEDIPFEIRAPVQEKRSTRFTWQKNHRSEDKSRYEKLFRELKNKLQNLKQISNLNIISQTYQEQI